MDDDVRAALAAQQETIDMLAKETLAFQAIVPLVLKRIASLDPRFAAAIAQAFDDAAHVIESYTIAVGQRADPNWLAAATAHIEQLRSITLDHADPRPPR